MIEKYSPSSFCVAVSRLFVATKRKSNTDFYDITELMGKRVDAFEKYEAGVVVCKGAMGYFAAASWSDYDTHSDKAIDLRVRGLFPDFKDAYLFARILDGTDSLKCVRI